MLLTKNCCSWLLGQPSYNSSSTPRRDAGATQSAEKLVEVPAAPWRTGMWRRSKWTGLVSLSWVYSLQTPTHVRQNSLLFIFQKLQAGKHPYMCNGTKYSRTPFIRNNWDGEPSGYAEIPDNWIFLLKIGYIGSLKWKQISKNGCFRLHIF